MAPKAAGFDPAAVEVFTYDRYALDLTTGRLSLHYRLGDLPFVEEVRVAPAPGADPVVADRAARLVFLLAGISYYKAAAPPVVDLGGHGLTAAERAMLDAFYRDGLGEYAYRNGLDLSGLVLRAEERPHAPHASGVDRARPLVPFGGGIDSIVTVEEVRDAHPDTALFVLSRTGDRFAALEAAAAVTRLPVRRAERELDPKILRSGPNGYRNGHVPVTGIVSAIANLVAVLDGRGAVVMSNEWSASSGNLVVDGRVVNHQYSKSATFERLLAAAIGSQLAGGPAYFSLLRASSELAIARLFAELVEYHPVFRSCNRAFHLDAAHRHLTWCGVCDKCCFIDLVLAPYLTPAALDAIFDGREPLRNPANHETFRTLCELGDAPKPFECVGERSECRAALQLAAARPDRTATPLLGALRDELRGHEVPDEEIAALLGPLGEHATPEDYAPRRLLG